MIKDTIAPQEEEFGAKAPNSKGRTPRGMHGTNNAYMLCYALCADQDAERGMAEVCHYRKWPNEKKMQGYFGHSL